MSGRLFFAVRPPKIPQFVNELISVDILGIINIWDTSTLLNFQSININESAINEANHLKIKEEIFNKNYKKKLSSNIYIQTFPDLKKFLIYGKKFLLFEKGNLLNPLLCDDYMIIGCFYNPKLNNIITISNKKVKFWNIFSGKLMKMYSDLMDSDSINQNAKKTSINDYEISGFAYDLEFKKLYLGDSLGRIKSFYLSTGDYIKQFEPHKCEITNIIYSNKYDYLITCSSDLRIKFHKDNEQKDNDYKVIKDTYIIPQKILENSYNKIFLKKIVFDEQKGLLICCLSNGLINEYDLERFKMINEIDTIFHVYKTESTKTLPHITSGEYIKGGDMFFISLDNNTKKLVTLKHNKYFNLLREQYIGNFIEDNQIKNNNDYSSTKKYIILYSYYNSKAKKLFTGDSFGFLICHDLSSIFDNFMNKKFNSNNDVKDSINSDLNFPEIYKVQLFKEPITYIFKPKELIPHILITVSIDRTVKLVDFTTGEYIDSLRQISIKENPFPIAVRFFKDNPFERKKEPILSTEENKDKEEEKKKIDDEDEDDEFADKIKKYLDITPNSLDDEEEIENKKNFPYIIYRKDVHNRDSNIPKINKLEHRRQELINYSNAVLLHTVKEKLRIPKFGKQIPEEKSTSWNYQIDIEYLKKIIEEDFSNLSKKVGNKEKEIDVTENNFKLYEIENSNYFPKYIKDLGQNDKDKIKNAISNRLKEVTLAFNKRAKTKKEMKEYSDINKKINLATENHNLKKSDGNNFFLTPIKPIKADAMTNRSNVLSLPIIDESMLNLNDDKKEPKKEKKAISSFKSYKKLSNIRVINSPSKYRYNENFYQSISLSNEDKFKEFKNQFDEKINEILGPIELIKLMKKKQKFK